MHASLQCFMASGWWFYRILSAFDDSASLWHHILLLLGSANIGSSLPNHVQVSVFKIILKRRDGSWAPDLHMLSNGLTTSDKWSVCWDHNICCSGVAGHAVAHASLYKHSPAHSPPLLESPHIDGT